jgi:ribosomal protein S18 acetylase RimI-like enzyme
MPITSRDAAIEDEAFLLELYASTRAQEMALLPWTNEQREAFVKLQFAAQHEHYHKQYPDADYKLILQDNERVGRLYILKRDAEITILDITVYPQYRNHGIGTSLLRDVLVEAAQTQRSVGIYVESFNPSLSLFERLGFSEVEKEGLNLLLRWHPPAESKFSLSENEKSA